MANRWAFGQPELICHCLLIEASSELILVDTGVGLKDIERPSRLGPSRFALRPKLNKEETALKQIVKLGFKPEDVRHILLTNLSINHIAGIADFPHASIHVFAPEFIAAMAPATIIERLRYRKIYWEHGPKWKLYRVEGEVWNDFECVRNLQSIPPEIFFIPLTGYTLGQCGIVIEQKDKTLIHAGDAYFSRSDMDQSSKKTSPFQQLLHWMETENETHMANLKRLRTLSKDPKIKVFSSHDRSEFKAQNEDNR